MARRLVWIAGPIQYWEGNYSSFDIAWDFIGGNADGEIRRWRLRYKAGPRVFAVYPLNSDIADQTHGPRLRALYQHAAVPADHLPRGAVIEKLKAMLPKEELAAALALSISKGKKR